MATHALLQTLGETPVELQQLNLFRNDDLVVVQLDDDHSLQVRLALLRFELLRGHSEDVREFCLWNEGGERNKTEMVSVTVRGRIGMNG